MGVRAYRWIVLMSLQDWLHETKLSVCGVIGIAAVLTPILVLFGLKFGVVSAMTDRLASDPRARALQPVGQGRYDAAWLAALAKRPQTGFLLPNTRFLAASVLLDSKASGRSVDAEFLPSADGDPLLPAGFAWPQGSDGPEPIVLSASAAQKLRAKPGGALSGSIGRTYQGDPQSVSVPLRVEAVLPPAKFERDAALVRLPFLLACEDYREGIAVPARGWTGHAPAPGPRLFASFRLYARTVHDVAALRDVLAAAGVNTVTQLAAIELVERLDRDLSLLFLVVAGLGSLGYWLAMTVSFWATVVRKQRELSLLRLLGFPTGAILCFPLVQAAAAGALGAAVASGVTLAVAPLLNGLFGPEMHRGESVFRLLPEHYAAAALGTLAFAALAAGYGGIRAARIAPGEGLREE